MERVKAQVDQTLQAGHIPQQEADALDQLLDAAARQTLEPDEVLLNLARVRAVLGQITPGVAVTLQTASASVIFDNCEIVGVMSCYGAPEVTRSVRMRSTPSVNSATSLPDCIRRYGPDLRSLRNTTLVRLMIGNQMLEQIRSLLHTGAQIPKVYASALLADCILLTGGNFIVSRGTQTSSLQFDAVDNLNTVADVLGDYGSFVGICYTGTTPVNMGPPPYPQLCSFTRGPPAQAAISHLNVNWGFA